MTTPKSATEEAARRLEGITPEPWAWEPIAEKSNEWAVGQAWDKDGNVLSGKLPAGESLEDVVIERRLVGMNESGHANFKDAEFIAAAPRLVRALLDELTTLRAAQEAQRQLVALVADLQAHAKEHGWQYVDEPIAALLAATLPAGPPAPTGAP